MFNSHAVLTDFQKCLNRIVSLIRNCLTRTPCEMRVTELFTHTNRSCILSLCAHYYPGAVFLKCLHVKEFACSDCKIQAFILLLNCICKSVHVSCVVKCRFTVQLLTDFDHLNVSFIRVIFH